MESIIQKALKILLDKFGAEYDCITISEESGRYRANIETSHPARIIGKNGDVLTAIQTLLKNILWQQQGENIFVSVDVDNYRKSQEDKIIERAASHIETMKEQNLSEIKLPPMNPFFRRVVHLWIKNEHPSLTTESVDEGSQRAIRVIQK